jgi:ribosome-interacting GTPase 1
MPANLTPQYFAAEQKWREATTLEEQIAALREMLSVMPKHKGTDKLQADLKRRIAKLQQEVKAQRKKGGRRAQLGYVPHEGAGQVAVIGPPNVGKSALIRAITHAHPEVAAYPFTTQKPQAAMMPCKDIQIQLVDTPAISEQYTPSWMPNLIRLADLALLVVDLGDDPADQAQAVIDQMSKTSTHLDGKGGQRDGQSAIVAVKTIIVGTKSDLTRSDENLRRLRDKLGDRFQISAVSAEGGQQLDELRQKVFQALKIVRVYTKEPGKKADLQQPYVLKQGSTVLDLAATIHRDFASDLKYARIWGSEKYDGQNVHKDHILEDGDIIELHLK